MSHLFPAGILLGLAVSLAGCGGSDTPVVQQNLQLCDGSPGPADCPAIPAESVGQVASQDLTENQTAVDPALVTANNNFGLNVLSTLLSQGASGNTAIAPVSLAETLEVAYNGAAGTTQQAIAQVLQFDVPGPIELGGIGVQRLNTDNAALQAALYHPDSEVTSLIYSSLWGNFTANPPTAAFNQINTNYYGADLGDLSAVSTVASMVDTIDFQAQFQTYELVNNILGSTSYNLTNDNVLLVSTGYFKGPWLHTFAPSLTGPGSFTNSAGAQTAVTMMTEFAILPYLQEGNFQAVSLPYGAGKRLAMLVVVPAEGTDLNTFVAGVSAAAIEQWESELAPVNVGLNLPRFTSSYVGSVQGALTALGMGVAFDSANANFSGLGSGDYLQDVLHGAVVFVNENGTTVPAPSVTGGQTNEPVAPITLTVDRPFFYAIRDNQSGELLVVGVVTNPGSG